MDQQIMITNKNNNILRRMNRDSQTILSKNKPKVRIIHIFAPEIIKIDPADFRELVQRLTGKPSSTRERMVEKKIKKSISANNNKRSDHHGRRRASAGERSSVEIAKSEEAAEIWRSSSSSGDNESGGFLTGFSDMEYGFMQQLGYFQPSLDVLPKNHNPLLMHHHHHHHYTHNPQRHHQLQQQQQHHFLGEEDRTNHNRAM